MSHGGSGVEARHGQSQGVLRFRGGMREAIKTSTRPRLESSCRSAA